MNSLTIFFLSFVILQTMDQFEQDGCDNCDSFLRMKKNRDNVYDCTSSNFDGYVNHCVQYFSLTLQRVCSIAW
jgi:hypothetical protein